MSNELNEVQMGGDTSRIPIPPWTLNIPNELEAIEEILLIWSRRWGRKMFRTSTEEERRYSVRSDFSSKDRDFIITLNRKEDGSFDLLISQAPGWGFPSYFTTARSLLQIIERRLHVPIPDWKIEESITEQELEKRHQEAQEATSQNSDESLALSQMAQNIMSEPSAEESSTPKLIEHVSPPILWPPWSVVFNAPRDKVENAIEASIKMQFVYAAEKTIDEGIAHYLIFSRMFKDSDPPVCTLQVSSKGGNTSLAVDPPTGRTYGSFFEVLSALMKIHGIVIPGTERPLPSPTPSELRTKQTYEDAKAKLEVLQESLARPLLAKPNAEPDAKNGMMENLRVSEVKRRRGGRKAKELGRRREIVDGWLRVQADELQEIYCERVGISPRTLREWMKELNS